MPVKWNMNVFIEEKYGLLWPDALIEPAWRSDCWVSRVSFSEFFNHFTEYYGMGNSLLFRRIPLSQLAYLQFPVISNKEKFVLAFVINTIFPVIYFYDDNPLFSTLKNTSVFCFHGAKCSQAKEETAYESMQWSKRRKQVPTRIVKMLTHWLTKE